MSKLKWVAPVFLILINSNNSFAESNRGGIFKLAENVRSALWRSDPVPEKFELTQDEADRAVAYAGLEEQISDYAYSTHSKEGRDGNPCPPTLDPEEEKDKLALQDAIENRTFSIYFTGMFASEDALSQAEGAYGRRNYRAFMNALSSRGVGKAGSINTLGKLENKYLKSSGAVENWESLSAVEQSKLLQAYAESEVGGEVSVGLILSEYAIQDMIANPSDWKKSLNEAKEYLSFDEKVKIASHFGGEFSDRYNYGRANEDGDLGEGIVTIEDMLTSISTNEPGGICRDVALAQSQILRELGVGKDDIYMIGYATATGGHAVLAIKDPNDPKNIVKLNYSYVSEESDVGGGAQLSQDTTLPDVGMNFRVYDADGKPVGKVPTEMGEIFNEVTGGKSYDLGKSYTLQKAVIKTPIGNGTAFTGRTSSGENVIGVAVNKEIKSKYMETEYGLAVAHREGDRTHVALDQTSFYARMNSRLNTPELKFGDQFSVKGFGGAKVEMMGMKTTVKYHDDGRVREGSNLEPMSSFYGGVEADWESKDGRTKVNSEVVSEYYVDWNNEVNTSEGQGLAFDNVRWTTSAEHGVTDHMKLIGEGTIIMRQTGTTGLLKGGVYDDRTKFSLEGGYQMPLSDDIPTFIPGSTKAVSVGVGKSWKDEKGRGPSVILEYERDLDFDTNRIGATAGWVF